MSVAHCNKRNKINIEKINKKRLRFLTELLHCWARTAFELKSGHAPLMLNTATHSMKCFPAANPVMFSLHALAILWNCLSNKVPPSGPNTTVSRSGVAFNTDGPSLSDLLGWVCWRHVIIGIRRWTEVSNYCTNLSVPFCLKSEYIWFCSFYTVLTFNTFSSIHDAKI